MKIDGMLVIRKEPGYTSNDVVCRLRGILHMKKIGHTGTLDPQARGVLPVCLGSGTKLVPLIENTRKEYIAECRLGVLTDTQDMTGTVLETFPEEAVSTITEDQVLRAMEQFRGEILQVPPMYSAIKKDGKKLYELARAGKTIEREPRRITIEAFELLEMKLPVLTLKIRCSKGTYIRTLCEDLGKALGVGGAMESLLRTQVGVFGLEQALTLSEVEKLAEEGEEKVNEAVLPVESFFSPLRALLVTGSGMKALENGNAIPADRALLLSEDGETSVLSVLPEEGERFRVYGEDGKGGSEFYAVYRWDAEKKTLQAERMFHAVAGLQ